jgi:integrase
MKKEGYREATIRRYSRIVRTLSKTSDLLDAEAVKTEIARKNWSEGTKELACDAYSLLAKSKGFDFHRPRYERIEKLPFIPLESEIDALVSGTGPKTSTTLQLLKETAGRIGEIWNLKWTDIDFERSVVTLSPEKGSKPRQFRISSKLSSSLSRLPRKNIAVFGAGNVEKFRRNYELQRKRLAAKLGNPRLHQITLHTFRHWKATYEYHKTRDILHVMQFLGHKSIRNTLRYTQLVDWKSDDYVCKTAKSLSEASSLIEAGFEYVTELEGVKLFRKRK